MLKNYIVCYDIAQPRRRRRSLRILRGQSGGYQHSCFEVCLSRVQFDKLLAELLGELDVDEDKLLVFPVSGGSTCWQLGVGPIQLLGNLFLVT